MRRTTQHCRHDPNGQYRHLHPCLRSHASRQPHIQAHAVKNDDSLAQWLVACGGTVTGVKLQRTEHGRTFVATEDHPPGRLLVSVPRQCQLRYDDVTDPRLLKLFERVPKGSDSGGAAWQYKQALTLLWHQSQGAASPLHTYLQMLPGAPTAGVGLPDVGMHLPDSVVEELQDPFLIQDILNHKYWLPQFYETELAPLNGSPESPFGAWPIDAHTFGAAVAVVISRCFGLRHTPTHVMPPLVDMADHVLDPNCDVISDRKTGAITLTTTRPIQAGSAVVVSYGRHANADLVLSYGFALHENPNDKFIWTWDLDVLVEIIRCLGGADWVQSPIPTWQQALLIRVGLPVNGTAVEPHFPLSSSVGLPAAAATAPSAAALALDVESNQHTAQQGSESSSSIQQQSAHSSNEYTEAGQGPTPVTDQEGEGRAVANLVVGGHPPVDGRLLAAVRVLLAPAGGEHQFVCATAEDLCDWDKPVKHEARVMTALSCVCISLYQSFPTTIQQDRTLLHTLNTEQENSPPDHAKDTRQMLMAVTFRLSMKLALERALKDIVARGKELELALRVPAAAV